MLDGNLGGKDDNHKPVSRVSPMHQARGEASQIPDALREVLLARSRPQQVKSGQVVIVSGEATRHVYLVVEGTMRTALFASTGREVAIRDIAQGELFGEMAALDGLPRSSTVVAASDATLAVVSEQDFTAAIAQDGLAALWLLRRFSMMVRLLTQKVFELSALPVHSRLHCELLRMAADGTSLGSAVLIDPAPTHADLAARVGSHREMVTREFRYLSDQGILRQQGRKLTLLNLAQLMHEIQRVSGNLETGSGYVAMA